MLTITITSTNPATYEVRVQSHDCDIFALVIGDLKRRIPPSMRNYNPTWKAWFIKREAAHYLTRWIEQAQDAFSATVEGDPGPWAKYRRPDWQSTYEYDDGSSYSPPPRRPRAVPSEAEAYAALCLTPQAPAPLVRAAYRELAKLHHPDTKGGDTAARQRLNHAYEVLKPRIPA